MRRRTASGLVLGIWCVPLLMLLAFPILYSLLRADVGHWIGEWSDPRTIQALTTSALASVVAVSVAAVLGIPAGYLLVTTHFRGKEILIGLIALPTVVPGLIGGVVLLQAFGPEGVLGAPAADLGLELTRGLVGVILVQTYVCSPLVVISSIIAFRGVDPDVIAAASTLGDAPWRVFVRVSLPLAARGILAGLLLAWMRAIGEFGATMIVAYNPQSLPVHLWTRFEVSGLAGALPIAGLLVVLAIGTLGASRLLSGSLWERRTRDARAVRTP